MNAFSKKLSVLFMTAALLVSVTACAKKPVENEPDDGGNVTPEDGQTVYEKNDKLHAEFAEAEAAFKAKSEYLEGLSAQYKDLGYAEPLPFKREYDVDTEETQNKPLCEYELLYEGSQAAINNDVYIGKDTWMFYKESISDYTGTNLPTDEELATLLAKYKKQYDYCKENGIDFYVLIGPNKNTVYPELMPASVTQAEVSRLDKIVDYFKANSEIPLIDVRTDLEAAKTASPDTELYFRYDTHWNQHAGFIAVNALLTEMQKNYPQLSLLNADDYRIDYTDTYMKDQAWYLGYYEYFKQTAPQYTLKTGSTARCIYVDNMKRYGVFQFAYIDADGYTDGSYDSAFKNDDKADAPSVMMFRDSFGIALIPFLKEQFSEITFNWGSFNITKVNETKPQVVIVEMLERTVS